MSRKTTTAPVHSKSADLAKKNPDLPENDPSGNSDAIVDATREKRLGDQGVAESTKREREKDREAIPDLDRSTQ